ncbi:MerR family transcriptional regulator [Hyphobacterium marinum]|uniref:Helix-turn-helix domain-containing protein n=1 Tax=Hyphobacterium marinum TaxID=3116574 RepID=A0ABU7LXK9_9PROT|nr:helix-turn-helix domain-containing protein [Hyphobacterium sp. Y6023]MEE2566287.1 helix-turn-helix domain-containing protein [Hyphobacterium sp. Y6023]
MSRRTGVKVTTIRYYEHNGLMPEPARAASGHRRYDGAALERLSFIRQARELGFELSAIRELLDLAADPDRPCSAADSIAKRHVAAISERIARLTALRAELQRVVETCGSGTVGDCRVLQSIADRAEATT